MKRKFNTLQGFLFDYKPNPSVVTTLTAQLDSKLKDPHLELKQQQRHHMCLMTNLSLSTGKTLPTDILDTLSYYTYTIT